jgi:aminoglycoside phosphotransferase (APT) family kinase protein
MAAAQTGACVDSEEIRERLGPALCEALSVEAVTVEPASVRRLTGGSVHESWAVDLTVQRSGGASETLRLVLRAFLPYGPLGTTAWQEFSVLRAAVEVGVTAPRPLALLEEGLSLPFFLMERIEGETIGRRLITQPAYKEAREVLAAQLGSALARIHTVPLTPELREFLRAPAEGESPAQAELAELERTYREITPDPHPAFELAFRWLAQHAPSPAESIFVHGDYRVGNVIFGPEGLRSVLDWEAAHIGDPAEDLGWLCVRSWRFGGSRPAGGVGSYEQLFRAYEAAGGRRVDPEQVRWWEVYGNLRWGVITLQIADPFLQGQTHDIEPGSIGRRATETEWELLTLMEGGREGG